ncbi:MAG: restriction endonuclease subunit M [Candidatus Nanosyncoccaceae bacterium]
MYSSDLDILENTIRSHDELLDILLFDHTRSTAVKKHNILWATDSYASHKATDEIKIPDITGDNTYLIQPRIAKTKAEQKARTQDKAEVFTPREIVAEMNQQADWAGSNWPTDKNNWQDYVAELHLEITCGEAPFIVGRYNAANGKKVLKLSDRVGFLDRKLQIVSKYCDAQIDWLEWAKIAFRSSYGYEWQGDNLLLARENLLYTFVDYWNAKFTAEQINLEQKVNKKHLAILKDIANIISWNIFQMDGIKFVIPMSCKNDVVEEEIPPMLALLGEKTKKTHLRVCEGCAKNDPFKHNGKYAYIMDWRKGKKIKFVNTLRPEKGKK